MKLDTIARNLRVLWRADAIIAEIHIRQFAARSGLIAAAGAIAIFSLLMFDLAAFFALEGVWGSIWAAAALGAANLLIALSLIAVASNLKPGRELDLAYEIHGNALKR